jgi:N-acetylmuramoyl-L-alanine amidase
MLIFTRMKIFIIFYILLLTSSSWASQQPCADNRSIYIDPFFGGRDDGPKIGLGYKAKDLTLELGLKLSRLLEGKGVKVCISRDHDLFLNSDQRLKKAKVAQARFYLAITMSSLGSKPCIRLQIPKLKKHIAKKSINPDSILQDIRRDNKIQQSIAAADYINNSIVKNKKYICTKILTTDKALITKLDSPSVIMDFGVSDDPTEFMRETILSDEFVANVVNALNAYLSSNNNQDPNGGE